MKQYLTNAYDLASSGQTRDLYRDWAATYDAEITANGYASPHRTAQALVSSGACLNAPLLDIGCGTGVSGLFLRDAGFTQIHGSDFSEEMISLAREKQIYDEIFTADLHKPFDFITTVYQTIAAIGVLAPGHAQADIIPAVIKILPPGGLFAFSMNDHTMNDPGYELELERLVMSREVRVRWRDYGDHLPKIKLHSMIIVLEKLAS